MKRIIQLALLLALAAPAWATNHFVRVDGGTLKSTNVPGGLCDGLSDLPAAGAVSNHCAVNDFRYAWDDDSGIVGAGSWSLSNTVGGDTWVIRGCHALPITSGHGQINPSDPDCRIGWDQPVGIASPPSAWCVGVGSYTCFSPPIPAGTSGAHTIIESGWAFDHPGQKVARADMAQLFCGFSLNFCFNLQSTQYVETIGLEITTHNQHWNGSAWSGNCTRAGTPSWPVVCANNQPLDDYADNGIVTSNTTANVLLRDTYIHGFAGAGWIGPIGGPVTILRQDILFNGTAGINFADASDTPNGAGSTLTGNYVTIQGSGCYEQYPIVNVAFPARACYDDLSGGFGDPMSGQDTALLSATFDHLQMLNNTKDGFLGPHTQIKNLTITNSVSAGNMGEQWKWGTDTNATVLFQNNLTVGNAYRFTATIPGAAQNFSLASGLGGSYLSDFGRAGGDTFSLITQAGSTQTFVGNTTILATNTGVDQNCGLVDSHGGVTGGGTCGAVPNVWKDNVFLGYIDPNCSSCGGLAPGLWFAADSSISFTSTFNSEFGIRNGDPCTGNILCTDPQLNSQPAQTWPGSEAALDIFSPSDVGFYPLAGSPLIGAGTPVGGLTDDYYGTSRPNPPWLGAVNSLAPVASGGVSVGGGVVLTGSVIMQ